MSTDNGQAGEFSEALRQAGLLADAGELGIPHRSFLFERIVRGLAAYVSSSNPDELAQQWYFSPLVARSTIERTGYLSSFPDLLGTVSTFGGSDAEHADLLARLESGGDWTELLRPSNIALCPAGCHPVYPLVAGTPVPLDGLRYEIEGYCFRHEPSTDPGRLQSFRMREFVYLGTPEGALEHRDQWIKRGLALLTELGLPVAADVANDPFFGRAGRMLAAGQRDRELKYELLASISSEVPNAIASANYHEDHFATSFNLRRVDGEAVHSACVGFGLERITLALLWHHGVTPRDWPTDVRLLLGLD